MTFEATLRTRLVASIGAHVGNADGSFRIYYFRAPQSSEGKPPARPFVVFTVVNREFVADLDGPSDRAMSTVQFDVCADRFETASAIAHEIKAALTGWDEALATNHVEEEAFLDEAVEPPLPRHTQVWNIWHDYTA
jgi:hypothetical protein